MCELIWTNIASVATVLLFIAGLNVLWQHIQVACPRSAWADWEILYGAATCAAPSSNINWFIELSTEALLQKPQSIVSREPPNKTTPTDTPH